MKRTLEAARTAVATPTRGVFKLAPAVLPPSNGIEAFRFSVRTPHDWKITNVRHFTTERTFARGFLEVSWVAFARPLTGRHRRRASS